MKKNNEPPRGAFALRWHRGARLAGAPVRVQIERLDGAWLEGRVFAAPLGCTMVRLDDERRAGMASVPLQSVRELQWVDASGRWSSLPVEALRAGDPARCDVA